MNNQNTVISSDKDGVLLYRAGNLILHVPKLAAMCYANNGISSVNKYGFIIRNGNVYLFHSERSHFFEGGISEADSALYFIKEIYKT